MRQHQIAWIQLKRFCELTGYTRDSIYAKMQRGVWAKGLHWRKAPDGHIMVNTEAYRQWVESTQV